jgi:REP element-mobilizing transposase RayT
MWRATLRRRREYPIILVHRHTFAMILPRRTRPAQLPLHHEAGRSTLVFLTVCTAARKRILATAAAHSTLLESWQVANSWMVGRYVIMPDHIHLFCTPRGKDAPPLAMWVAFWKSHASRRWPKAEEHPVWQAAHWDRQLRAAESYAAKWRYVRENPVRAGLVARATEWRWVWAPGSD